MTLPLFLFEKPVADPTFSKLIQDKIGHRGEATVAKQLSAAVVNKSMVQWLTSQCHCGKQVNAALVNKSILQWLTSQCHSGKQVSVTVVNKSVQPWLIRQC